MATRQTTDAPLKHLRDDERVGLGRRAGYGVPAGSDTDEDAATRTPVVSSPKRPTPYGKPLPRACVESPCRPSD